MGVSAQLGGGQYCERKRDAGGERVRDLTPSHVDKQYLCYLCYRAVSVTATPHSWRQRKDDLPRTPLPVASSCTEPFIGCGRGLYWHHVLQFKSGDRLSS